MKNKEITLDTERSNDSNSEIIGEQFENAHKKIICAINEVEKVVIGKRKEIVLLFAGMLSGSHVLIEDVPGTGKTSLASTMAKVIGFDFKRAQFTPDIMASDITGFNIYNRQKEEFELRDGLVMCNLLLADEINRASPKTQSALLEAMEEGKVTVDGQTLSVPDPFMVIATQNPTGYVGTYPLPEAQLDRFAIKISMGYPTQSEEVEIIKSRHSDNPINSVSTVLTSSEISEIKNLVRSIHIDDEIYAYIASLIHATRKHASLSLGASPRASVALMRMSCAYAFIKGREYVIPEDIASVFYDVIAHRLILKQEAKLSGLSAYDILSEILRTVEVPYKGKR